MPTREPMDLRERVREWLVDAKVGLIEPSELVSLADQMIQRIDEPPDYLFAISFNESLDFEDRLDLVKDPLGSADLQRLAARLLKRYESGGLSVDQVGAIAARVEFPHHDEQAVDPWVHFSWITDELELVETGCKDRSTFESQIVEVLKRASGVCQ